MRHITRNWRLLIACTVCALGAAVPALPQDQPFVLELNKLEQGENETGCQAFFLLRNRSERTLEAFELSLAILDDVGMIDRLLSVDAAPAPANRTTLRLFEIPVIQCDDISEIIVHDIPACTAADGETVDCYALMDIVSRADVRFTR